MMELEKGTLPNARFNKRTQLWEVRLAETIVDATKETAERRAVIVLGAYHAAAKLMMSPFQITNESVAAECDYWRQKYEELLKATGG